MGAEPETLPYSQLRSPHTCAGFMALCGDLSFLVSYSACALLCKGVHHIASSQPHCSPSPPWGRDRVPSTEAQEECKWKSTHNGRLIPTIGTDLKVLFHPVLCFVSFVSFVSFDNSDTKLQWSEVFGIFCLVVGIVMIFALLTVGNINPPLGLVMGVGCSAGQWFLLRPLFPQLLIP